MTNGIHGYLVVISLIIVLEQKRNVFWNGEGYGLVIQASKVI